MIQRLTHWGDVHHPKWVEIFRILLGAFFLWKAFEFINSMNQLATVMFMDQSNFVLDFTLGAIRFYTIMVHIIGGFMVLFGVYTRFWCLIQIPILLLAMFFYHSPTMVMSPDGNLGISVGILLLTIFVTIEGSGPWSADKLLKDVPMRLVR